MFRTGTSRVYTVSGAVGLAIAASTGAGPGVSARLPFQFPRALFVTGILAIPRGDAAVDEMSVVAAGLSMSIVDESTDLMISDGRGTLVPATGGTSVVTGAALQLLHGFGWHPFALQRPVAQGDKWFLQLQNAIASVATMAGIYIFGEVSE